MLALIRIGIETETKKAKRRTPRPIEDQELAS